MELKYRHSEESIALIGCFNRTFMELKSENIYAALGIKYVLIVPLWNWNNISPDSQSRVSCFNRTFMELKLSDRLVTEETEGLF